ncbi:MAG: hypothetical protein MO847_12290, partial [Candidatus Protistobacter heckmanni]|nr:hypothetical protein [Candidatus Protistobacter heckmanni]
RAFPREFFAYFIRSRGIARHFRRFSLFHETQDGPRELPPGISAALMQASSDSAETLLARLNSRPDGLQRLRTNCTRQRQPGASSQPTSPRN